MAFPQVAAAGTVYAPSTATTSHAVDLPDGIVAGSLVVVPLAVNVLTANSTTWPTGWVKDVNDAPSGGSCLAVFASKRVQAGDPELSGSTVTFTTAESVLATGVAWRITGPHTSTSPSGSTATGSNATPDPPSHSPAEGGTEDRLWVALHSTDNLTGTNTFPSGYDTNQASASVGATSGSRVAFAVATREVAAATEDPGAFGIAASRTWVAATIAIRPAAGGGGDATAAPAATATTVATPAAAVSTAAAPGELATSTSVPAAAVSVAAVPGVAAATVTAPAPDLEVGAAPALFTATASLPATTVDAGDGNATATPATITATASAPQAGDSVGAAPAAVTVAATSPASQVAVAAAPAATLTLTAAPQVAASVAAAPTTLATAAAVPTPTAGTAGATAVRVRDGAGWRTATVRVRDGAGWRVATVRRRSGAGWA